MLTIACPPSHIIGIGLIIPDGNTDIAHIRLPTADRRSRLGLAAC
jgi:hypothetical protein